MRKLVIPGRLPGLNEAFAAARKNRHLEASLRSACETEILMAARRWLKGWKARGPVILHYTFYEESRRCDKDNVFGYACKLIHDSLVKGKYLKNDGWADIENVTFAWAVDKKRPRIEVEIEEINHAEI